MPVPHARPFLPNNTENGPATTFQSPPRGRSNNRNSPRIEFHVGAIPSMSCVQSSGTPSANVCMPMSIKRHITQLHKLTCEQGLTFNIALKGNHVSRYLTRCHIRITDATRILFQARNWLSHNPLLLWKNYDTSSCDCLFGFGARFHVGA